MVNEDEYLAFGISGSDEKSQMIGADVAVAYINGYQGYATDYNITALTPVSFFTQKFLIPFHKISQSELHSTLSVELFWKCQKLLNNINTTEKFSRSLYKSSF